MRPIKKSVSICLDTDVLERIRKAAWEEERSLSQYINLIMREHIREKMKEKERENKAE